MAENQKAMGSIKELFALPRWQVAAASAAVIAGTMALMWAISRYSYPLFHSLAEMFSIAVTVAVFSVAWNSRRFLQSGFLLVLGVASLFVGAIDLLHTLAFQGVAAFPGFDNDLPTQLWIASRSLQALSLLAASFYFLNHRVKPVAALSTFSAVTALLLLSILVWRIFPACYVEGQGLTPFKIGAEYVISAILLASLWPLAKPTPSLAPSVKRLLALFIACTILAELSFTFYLKVFGLGNLAGHMFKIIAYFWLYQALVVTGIKRPFELLVRDLKQTEISLRRERDLAESLIEAAPVIIALLDAEGRVRKSNPAMERMLELPPGSGTGLDWFDSFVDARDREEERRRFGQVIRGARDLGAVRRLLPRRGGEIQVHLFFRAIPDGGDGEPSVLVVGQNVTDAARREREREALLESREAALAQVKALSGMLPLCASCKKVRDDQGYWNQIEDYLRKHSEARFSHGICPECSAKVVEKLSRIKDPE